MSNCGTGNVCGNRQTCVDYLIDEGEVCGTSSSSGCECTNEPLYDGSRCDLYGGPPVTHIIPFLHAVLHFMKVSHESFLRLDCATQYIVYGTHLGSHQNPDNHHSCPGYTECTPDGHSIDTCLVCSIHHRQHSLWRMYFGTEAITDRSDHCRCCLLKWNQMHHLPLRLKCWHLLRGR